MPVNNCDKLYKEAFDSLMSTPGQYNIPNPEVQKLDSKLDSNLNKVKSDLTRYLKDDLGIESPIARIKYIKDNKHKDKVIINNMNDKQAIINEYNLALKELQSKPGNVNYRKWAKGKDTKLLFHGTGSNIEDIKISKSRGGIHGVKGFYTTTSSNVANKYAEGSNPNVLPLIGRLDKVADYEKTIIDSAAFGLDQGKITIKQALDRSKLTEAENSEIIKKLGFTTIKDGDVYIFLNSDDLKSKFASLFTEGKGLFTGLAAIGIGTQQRD